MAVITVTATDGANNSASTTYNTRIDNTAPTVTTGTIAACYTSVAAAEAAALVQALSLGGHCPLAVEMEGAAVAQVCADYAVPFAAVRTISDRADDTAHVDFPQFEKDVASVYARSVINRLMVLL